MTFDEVREIVLALPGTAESDGYSTPALTVAGKLLARMKEDDDTMVLLGVDHNARAALMEQDPEVFFVTEHYEAYPNVLVWLPRATRKQVEALLVLSWRTVAPPALVKEFDERPPAAPSPARS